MGEADPLGRSGSAAAYMATPFLPVQQLAVRETRPAAVSRVAIRGKRQSCGNRKAHASEQRANDVGCCKWLFEKHHIPIALGDVLSSIASDKNERNPTGSQAVGYLI